MKVIQFQLRDMTKQLIDMCIMFACTHCRINCIAHRRTEEVWTKWNLFIIRELSVLFREITPTIRLHCKVLQWHVKVV